MGRQGTFTQEAADAICSRLAEGESLRAVCRDEEMPVASTVFKWLTLHPDFAEQYARARAMGHDLLGEEILEIADTPLIGTKTKTGDDGKVETTTGDMIEHRRLQVDARKWFLSKLAPKKYGDKLELGGSSENPLNVIVRRLTDA